MLSLGESASFWGMGREVWVRFGLIFKCGGFDDGFGGFWLDLSLFGTQADNSKAKSVEMKILNIVTTIKPLSKNIYGNFIATLIKFAHFPFHFHFGFCESTAMS